MLTLDINKPKYTIWSKYHKGVYQFYDCYTIKDLVSTYQFLKLTSVKKSEKFGIIKNDYSNKNNYALAV